MEEIHAYSSRVNLLRLHQRLLNKFMDLLILSELKDAGAMSGYDIIKLVRRRFHILPGSGSVYSVLYSMERQGLVRGVWNERRRIYRLTKKGEAAARLTFNFYEKIEDLMRNPF